MNGNDLLEAMGYIDEEYIHMAQCEVPKKKHIHRWISAAACLCAAVLGVLAYRHITAPTGEETTSPSESSGAILQEPIIIMPGQHYAAPNRSEGTPTPADIMPDQWFVAELYYGQADAAETQIPAVTVIRDIEALESYCQLVSRHSDYFAVCESYVEGYFKQNDLLAVCVENSDGTLRYQVQALQLTDRELTVNILADRTGTAPQQPGMCWILIELHGGKKLDGLKSVPVDIDIKENNE